MTAIKELFQIDWVSVVLAIFIIMFGVKAIIDIIVGFLAYVGKPVKWIKKNNDDHELLVKTVEDVRQIREDHEEAVKQAIEHDEKLWQKLDLTISSINRLSNTVDSINARSIANNDATIEELHKIISEKCKFYIEIGGIPIDEYDWFFRIADCYTKCGGNHGLQEKVKYCKDNLKIL